MIKMSAETLELIVRAAWKRDMNSLLLLLKSVGAEFK